MKNIKKIIILALVFLFSSSVLFSKTVETDCSKYKKGSKAYKKCVKNIKGAFLGIWNNLNKEAKEAHEKQKKSDEENRKRVEEAAKKQGHKTRFGGLLNN